MPTDKNTPTCADCGKPITKRFTIYDAGVRRPVSRFVCESCRDAYWARQGRPSPVVGLPLFMQQEAAS